MWAFQGHQSLETVIMQTVWFEMFFRFTRNQTCIFFVLFLYISLAIQHSLRHCCYIHMVRAKFIFFTDFQFFIAPMEISETGVIFITISHISEKTGKRLMENASYGSEKKKLYRDTLIDISRTFLTFVIKSLFIVHREGSTEERSIDSSRLKSFTSLLSSSENMAIIFPP